MQHSARILPHDDKDEWDSLSRLSESEISGDRVRSDLVSTSPSHSDSSDEGYDGWQSSPSISASPESDRDQGELGPFYAGSTLGLAVDLSADDLRSSPENPESGLNPGTTLAPGEFTLDIGLDVAHPAAWACGQLEDGAPNGLKLGTDVFTTTSDDDDSESWSSSASDTEVSDVGSTPSSEFTTFADDDAMFLSSSSRDTDLSEQPGNLFVLADEGEQRPQMLGMQEVLWQGWEHRLITDDHLQAPPPPPTGGAAPAHPFDGAVSRVDWMAPLQQQRQDKLIAHESHQAALVLPPTLPGLQPHTGQGQPRSGTRHLFDNVVTDARWMLDAAAAEPLALSGETVSTFTRDYNMNGVPR
jgi:hypothetical protein